MESEVVYSLPEYKIVDGHQYEGTTYWIVGANTSSIPENLRATFEKDKEVTHIDGNNKTHFLTLCKTKSTTIASSCLVRVDSDIGDTAHHNYLGVFSDFLSTAHKFDRKQKRAPLKVVSVYKQTPKVHRAVHLAEARNRSREWANGRGDIEGTPQYFKKLAQSLADKHNLRLTVYSGQELVANGFRLMHAVGRASINEPVFVNLAYEGNPQSDKWTAFVGKGVCFDTGGYDIKTGNQKIMQLQE